MIAERGGGAAGAQESASTAGAGVPGLDLPQLGRLVCHRDQVALHLPRVRVEIGGARATGRVRCASEMPGEVNAREGRVHRKQACMRSKRACEASVHGKQA